MSQQQQQQTGTLIADLLAPFAEAASLRLRDASGTLRKRILVSLHFARIEQIHDRVFPGDHIEWPAVRAYLESEVGTTTAEWVRLISLLHFVAEPPLDAEFAKRLKAMSLGLRVNGGGGGALTPVDTMRLCFARAGVASVPWDLLCKALVLVNLTDIDASVGLQQLMLLMMSDQQQQLPVVDAVLKHMPSTCRHSIEEYTDAFAQLLGPQSCQVASHVVLHSIRCREKRQEAMQQSAQAALRSTQKPSLTRLLLLLQQSGAAGAAGASGAGGGFHRFCWRAQLPVDTPAQLKVGCYYLALLLPAAEEEAVRAALQLPPSARLACATNQHHHQEDADDLLLLKDLVLQIEHIGAPCAALQRFREEVGLPQRASWTTALRLYLTAYAPPPLNRELWWETGGSEAQREAFVRTHPPSLRDLALLMRQNYGSGAA